ncbi:MAG: hypothetical protein AMXMBFR55_01610 [Gemmatimonadota bacterium]
MSGRVVRQVAIGMLLVVGVACERAPLPAGKDTATGSPPPPATTESAEVGMEAAWDSSAGPVFLTIGPNAGVAAVVFPALPPDAEVDGSKLDPGFLKGSSFELFADGRVVSEATVRAIVPVEAPEECTGWPLVQLAGMGADSAGRNWAVGFVKGRVAPVAYDSIVALASADSSRLAMDVARIASSVPGDTVAEMVGLPYQVRRAYRFTAATGVDALVAEVLRMLNQEANPKQEHLFIIAERDSASRGRYEIAYSERAAGGEEVLESSEVLTIARTVPRGGVVMLLARYLGDGVVYSLFERSGVRRWRLRWNSPYVGC